MASVTPHKSGGWRVAIKLAGARRSRVFRTKSEATQWAAREEAAILAAERGQFPRRTLAQAIDKYVDEVSVAKAGARSEKLRLAALVRDFPALAGKVLSEVTTTDMAGWRNARLKKVSPGSVQRDINILSNLFTVARKEWKWCGPSPITDMRGPGDNPPRERLPTWREIRRLLRWLGYTPTVPRTKHQAVAWAFVLALRTGMRAGEVLSLDDEAVLLSRKVARVAHKMQYLTGRKREVPLTRQAVRLLTVLHGRGKMLDLSSASLDALWRKACASCGIVDLHFHDSRAMALTLLSKKVDILTLQRISGHRDIRMLSIYYRESAEQIAARL